MLTTITSAQKRQTSRTNGLLVWHKQESRWNKLRNIIFVHTTTNKQQKEPSNKRREEINALVKSLRIVWIIITHNIFNVNKKDEVCENVFTSALICRLYRDRTHTSRLSQCNIKLHLLLFKYWFMNLRSKLYTEHKTQVVAKNSFCFFFVHFAE